MQQRVTKQIVVRNAQPKTQAKPVTKVTTTTTAPAPKGRRRRSRQRTNGKRSQIPPYIQSLLDPDNVRGVSIPDGISMPTGTYAYSGEFSVPCDASGNGLALFNPRMFIGNAGGASVANGCGLLTGSSTAGFGSGAVALAPPFANLDASANVERFRVVSAELQLYSTAAPSTISGRVISALLPSDYDMGNGITLGGVNIVNLPNARTSHFIEGGRAIYLPGGPEDLLYAPCTNERLVIHGFNVPGASGQFASSNVAGSAQQTKESGPTLVVGVTGGTASVNLTCRFVVNIQYIAETANSFVALSTVQHDPAAMSWAQALILNARSLMGFLETHQETMASVMSTAGRVTEPALRSLGAYATNALIGQLLPQRRTGGIFPRIAN